MAKSGQAFEGKLMIERALGASPRSGSRSAPGSDEARPARSLSVNLAESPLGWLFARGHVSERQFLAGERLRWDWERAQLEPQVTMRWDASPMHRGQGGGGVAFDPCASQIAARDRFTAAVRGAGPGLSDIVWRIICAGEGMRQAETALGWPARAGKLVLGLALDRIADHYRLSQA